MRWATRGRLTSKSRPRARVAIAGRDPRAGIRQRTNGASTRFGGRRLANADGPALDDCTDRYKPDVAGFRADGSRGEGLPPSARSSVRRTREAADLDRRMALIERALGTRGRVRLIPAVQCAERAARNSVLRVPHAEGCGGRVSSQEGESQSANTTRRTAAGGPRLRAGSGVRRTGERRHTRARP